MHWSQTESSKLSLECLSRDQGHPLVYTIHKGRRATPTARAAARSRCTLTSATSHPPCRQTHTPARSGLPHRDQAKRELSTARWLKPEAGLSVFWGENTRLTSDAAVIRYICERAPTAIGGVKRPRRAKPLHARGGPERHARAQQRRRTASQSKQAQ